MKPRKHAGFRIAIALTVIVATLVFLGGLLSFLLSLHYGYDEEAWGSFILMMVSGGSGLVGYALLDALYSMWQKNDFVMREKANQRREFKRLHQTKVR